jgi:hypothetical protein
MNYTKQWLHKILLTFYQRKLRDVVNIVPEVFVFLLPWEGYGLG